MNIALYHNLPSGGARRAMVEMARELAARGHTVDEWCPETADLAFLPLDGVVRRTVVLPFRPRGVATTRVPLLTPYITAVRLAGDLRAMAATGEQAAKRIAQENYDLVFAHDCQLVLAPDILRFLRLPNVHYFHAGTRAGVNWYEELSPDGSLASQVKHLYYAPARMAFPRMRHRQARRNLRAVQRVLTNSHYAAAELQQDFGVTAGVCYLGVDGENFRPLGLPREPFVLSVGAVHYHKGYRFLVQALARLPEGQRPPLVIAANSVEPAELQALHELASELRVTFTVRQVSDESEMASLYNQAAAFVYCPIREPWGLAAVEAMACGAAVVAVGEGGVAESVVDGETGLLTSRDADAFAAALGHVLADPALAARLGAGGAACARDHFTWTATVDCLEAHLCEAARVGAPP
ncbi:MAG: glycosyltransferase family 4 protein [Caldilineaceae bacterium]|nr:glycosyltransferase family 4 protein [Caldilineaceae bacterium]